MASSPKLSPVVHAPVRERGFSLIEIIIVIALIAFAYTVLLPQLNMRTGAEIAQKTNQLASDIRSAYDMAVLTGKTYRMVFQMGPGDYWLEEADRGDVLLGDDKLDRDPSEADEKDEQVSFDGKFQEYVDLAGREVSLEDREKPVPPESPVIKAKDRLRRAAWTRVETMEWSARTLGPNLMITDMQSEHHGHKQELSELGPDARAMIYFFPHGYVQKAVIHIAITKDDMVPDESQEPYTVVTRPYEGIADVIPGRIEVDVHEDKEDN